MNAVMEFSDAMIPDAMHHQSQHHQGHQQDHQPHQHLPLLEGDPQQPQPQQQQQQQQHIPEEPPHLQHEPPPQTSQPQQDLNIEPHRGQFTFTNPETHPQPQPFDPTPYNDPHNDSFANLTNPSSAPTNPIDAVPQPPRPTEQPAQPALDPQFDIFEWYPKYQSCQRYFINHAQHSSHVQAVAAFVNIHLPFQRSSNPIVGNPPRNSPPSLAAPPSPPPHQASAAVSLISYLRRLVVTGLDFPGVLHGFFGDDWAAGVGPLHEQERRNYLFAAKSGGWASVKKDYDMLPLETVPFLRPLQAPVIAEIEAAEKSWSEWLAMEDWMVGPRAPEGMDRDHYQHQHHQTHHHTHIPTQGQDHVQGHPGEGPGIGASHSGGTGAGAGASTAASAAGPVGGSSNGNSGVPGGGEGAFGPDTTMR